MFFDRYNALCEARGLSCKAAAKEIGFSHSIITRWKNEGSSPNATTAIKIANFFGVGMDELLGIITLSNDDQKELFQVLLKGLNATKTAMAVAEAEAKVKSETIRKIGMMRMPRIPEDDIIALGKVLEIEDDVQAFLDKIKKPTTVVRDELQETLDAINVLASQMTKEELERAKEFLQFQLASRK